MKQSQKTLPLMMGGALLTGFVISSSAAENPFMAKSLPQGYMVVAENTLPDPQPQSNRMNNAPVVNVQIQDKTKTIASDQQSSVNKSIKSVDGGCGAGSCAAKLNKLKAKSVAK
ncbi:MAG: hypothetical protein HOP21_04210 [Methylotenera sp.]|nr:hypothetical protein [Methylotenera sp.]